MSSVRATDGSGTLPRDFRGGPTELWDRLHERNKRGASRGVYPLRSAPERAMLRMTLERAHLQPRETLLELGCGAARYLPQAARELRCRPHGVDFSSAGVEQTKRALESLEIASDGIVEARIEDYVRRHPNRFDAVVSYGLVEHFSDLDEVVGWHFRCLRIGGRVLIAAPNLHSWNLGWARRVAPKLFTWHQPISADAVAHALAGRGASEIEIDFLGGPRLFAYPEPDGRTVGQHALALIARKVVNGAGEVFQRVSARASDRLAGERMSPFFAVSATRTR
jgi:SAM-dependent methyltransferase